MSAFEVHGRKFEVWDVHASRHEYYFEPPRSLRHLLLRSIKDPRDAPVLFLLFDIVVFAVPWLATVCLLKSSAVSFAFWAVNVWLFQERFLIGMRHSHKGLFKSRFADWAVLAVLSPLFGIPCGLYYLHVVVHQWDLSSTETYQRDNPLHFLVYWLRFLLLIWFELPYYALRRRRLALALGACAGTICFFGMVWASMAWMFVLPTIVNSLLFMFSNWSQHIFIDPSKPRCDYHMTYNLINDPCNQRTFNDGYHIEHHANSRKHWSELPSSFVQNIDRYVEEDAIVFEGLNVFKVGMLVFLGRYDILAEHVVPLAPRSPEGVEAWLRSRLVPIGRCDSA